MKQERSTSELVAHNSAITSINNNNNNNDNCQSSNTTQSTQDELKMSPKEFVQQVLSKSFCLQDLSLLAKLIQHTTYCLKTVKILFLEFQDICAFYFTLTLEAIEDDYFHDLSSCLSEFYDQFCQTCYHWGMLKNTSDKSFGWLYLIEEIGKKFTISLENVVDNNAITDHTVPLALNTLLIIGITMYQFNQLSSLYNELLSIITNRSEKSLDLSTGKWLELVTNVDYSIRIYSSINLANRFEESDLKRFTLFIVEMGLDNQNHFNRHFTHKAIKDLASTLLISSRDLFLFFQKDISELLIKHISVNFEANSLLLYKCMNFFSISSLPNELLRWIIPPFAVKCNDQTRLLFDEVQKKTQNPAIYPIKLYLIDILIYIFYDCKGNIQMIYRVLLFLTEYSNYNVFTFLYEIFNAFTEAFLQRISLDREATLRGLSFIYNVTTSASKIDPEKLDAICDVNLDMFSKNEKAFVNFLQHHFPVYIHRIDANILSNICTVNEKVIFVQSFQIILRHLNQRFINRFRIKLYFTIRLLLSERHYSNRNLLKIGLSILTYFIENVEEIFLEKELPSICLLILPLVKILPDDASSVIQKLFVGHQYPTSIFYQLYFIPELPLLKPVNDLINSKINKQIATTSEDRIVRCTMKSLITTSHNSSTITTTEQLLAFNQLIDHVYSVDFSMKCIEIYHLLDNITTDNEKLQEVLLRRLYSLLDTNKDIFYCLYHYKSNPDLNQEVATVRINLKINDSNEVNSTGDHSVSSGQMSGSNSGKAVAKNKAVTGSNKVVQEYITVRQFFRHTILSLLQCVKFCPTSEIRNLATNCLGVLGAIDIGFLAFDQPFAFESFGSVAAIHSIDYCNHSLFAPNKKPFKLLILEILMNMVRTSNKTPDYNCASYAIQELLQQFTTKSHAMNFLLEDENQACTPFANTQQMDDKIENYLQHKFQHQNSSQHLTVNITGAERLTMFDQIKTILQNERNDILDLAGGDLTGELHAYAQVLEHSMYNSKPFDQFATVEMGYFFNSIKPSMSYMDFLKRFLYMLYHSFVVYHIKNKNTEHDHPIESYGEIFSQKFSNYQSQRCGTQYVQEYSKIVDKLRSLRTPKQIFIVCYHSIFRNIKLAYFLVPCLLLLSLGLGTDAMRQEFAQHFKTMIDRFLRNKLIFTQELGKMASELICYIYDYLQQWHRNRKLIHCMIVDTLFIRNRASRFDKEFGAVTLIMQSLSSMDMAKLAYEAGSYHKSLHYLEMHYNHVRHSSVSSVALESFVQENLDFFYKLYHSLDDYDSLVGLSRARENQFPTMEQMFHQSLAEQDFTSQLISGAKLVFSDRQELMKMSDYSSLSTDKYLAIVDRQEKYFKSLLQLDQDLSLFNIHTPSFAGSILMPMASNSTGRKSFVTTKTICTPNLSHYLLESAWKLCSWEKMDDLVVSHLNGGFSDNVLRLDSVPGSGGMSEFGRASMGFSSLSSSSTSSHLYTPNIGFILSSMFNEEATFVLDNKIMDVRANYLATLNASLLSNVSTAYARSYQFSIVPIHMMHDVQQFASTVYTRLLDETMDMSNSDQANSTTTATTSADEPNAVTSSSQIQVALNELLAHWNARNRLLPPYDPRRLQVVDVQRALIHLLQHHHRQKFGVETFSPELLRYWHQTMKLSLDCAELDRAYSALGECIRTREQCLATSVGYPLTEAENVNFVIYAAQVFWTKKDCTASLKLLRTELERNYGELKQHCYLETLKNLSQICESELLDITNSLSLKLNKMQFMQMCTGSSSGGSGGMSSNKSNASTSIRIPSATAVNQPPATSVSEFLESTDSDTLARYGRLQLEYAFYCDQARMYNSNTLIILYKAVTIACPQWENGHYHLAMFCRRLYKEYQSASTLLGSKTAYNIGKPDEILDLKARVIKSLVESLKYGSFQYVSLSLPALINTWVDLGYEYLAMERKHRLNESNRSTSIMKDLLRRITDRCTANVRQLTTTSTVNNGIFFVVLDILIGHMMHQYEPIARAIQEILVKLIADFPHHMAWQFSRSLHSNGRRGLVSKDFVAQAAKLSSNNPSYITRYFENFRYFSTGINELARYKPPKQPPVHSSRTISGQSDSRNELSLRKVCPGLVRAVNSPDFQFAIPCNQFFVPSALNLQRMSNAGLFSRFSKNLFIERVEDCAQIMKSLQMPKKLTFLCHNGTKRTVLCKCSDDLRKDRCMLNFCNLFNQCHRGEICTVDPMSRVEDVYDVEMECQIIARRRQSPLAVQTYFVAPLSDQYGVIEWIPGLCSLKSLVEGQYTKTRANKQKYDQSKSSFIKSVFPSNLTREKRIERFIASFVAFKPPVFQNWFNTHYADSYSWYCARRNYIRSAAVYSILGYILGLGDRHAENILLDPATGQVVHVDFNCLFNRGEDFMVPECVPFRLTHNMIAAMGALGFEGTFRRTAQDVLLVLRQFRELFANQVTIFLYDILLEWLECSDRAEIAEKSVFNVEARLYGITSRSSRKLPKGKAMSIVGQVDYVIKEATDINNLGAMYHGWASFI